MIQLVGGPKSRPTSFGLRSVDNFHKRPVRRKFNSDAIGASIAFRSAQSSSRIPKWESRVEPSVR
jgi:hypothetical protein